MTRLIDEARARWVQPGRKPVELTPFESLFGDFYAWNRDTKAAEVESKADPGFVVSIGGNRQVVLQRLGGKVCYFCGPKDLKAWSPTLDPTDMGFVEDSGAAFALADAYLDGRSLAGHRRCQWTQASRTSSGLKWVE